MGESSLPEEARAFIREHVNSVEQLEILLLLRDRRDKAWTAAAVAEEVRTGRDSAAARLADLASRGLLTIKSEAEAEYRYEPRTKDLDRAVGRLADAYPQFRHTIIKLIFSKPVDEILVFARAFRLRKDGDDDG